MLELRSTQITDAALISGTLLIYLIPLVPQAVLDVVFNDDPEKASGISRAVITVLGGIEQVGDQLWRPAILIGILALTAGVCVHLRQRFAARAARPAAGDPARAVGDRRRRSERHHRRAARHVARETAAAAAAALLCGAAGGGSLLVPRRR